GPLPPAPVPPLVLTVRGTLVAGEPAVAIVGARRASEYGQRMAAELATGLAHAGVTVVSGLAAGIDAAAHRAALGAGGRTIAVLGTGITKCYPGENWELAEAMTGSGVLVSQFWPTSPPSRFTFPRRNVVNTGISQGP